MKTTSKRSDKQVKKIEMMQWSSQDHTLLEPQRLSQLVESSIGGFNAVEHRDAIIDWFMKDMLDFLQAISSFEKKIIENYGTDFVNGDDSGLREQFTSYCDSILRNGERMLAGISNRRTRLEVKRVFRKILTPWIEGNPIIKRCLAKPRGYPGDYVMMEMAYEQELQLPGGLQGFFDRYFWDQYECVRCRKDVAKERIRKQLEVVSRVPRHILSLGGGPCREWYELAQERLSSQRCQAVFVCLDQDPEALDFAKQRLKDNPLLVKSEFIRESLLTFSTSPSWKKRTGIFDLIYGMGIANYFYDETLSRMITRSFDLLRPGSELIIEHKDRDAFRFAPADWLADWTFVIRGEEEFRKVFSDALSRFGGHAKWWIERDKTGELMFGVAKKQEE